MLQFASYLVAIHVKNDCDARPYDAGKFICTEECIAVAHDDNDAKKKAYAQFSARCHKDPIMRRRMEEWGLTEHDCEAKEAISF